MRRSIALTTFAVALGLVFAGIGSTAAGSPVLRPVGVVHGHLVLTFTLAPDSVPGRVLVATSSAGLSRSASGPDVKLRGPIHSTPAPATGLSRWRTRASLPAGTYYVEVSAIDTVGVTDCVPRRADCLTRWSNPRRVVVP
jgi:hypothetical protein